MRESSCSWLHEVLRVYLGNEISTQQRQTKTSDHVTQAFISFFVGVSETLIS